jgi:hypothetical protein
MVLGTVRTPTKGGFLAGNTLWERAEISDKTEVLVSKIKLYKPRALIDQFKWQFNLPYIELCLNHNLDYLNLFSV